VFPHHHKFVVKRVSVLVLQNVTGPIKFSVGPGVPCTPAQAVDARQRPSPEYETTPPVARNISFNNIHGTVTTDLSQLSETTIASGYIPDERHSCITLNLRRRIDTGECFLR
jgi:hypothetical protein